MRRLLRLAVDLVLVSIFALVGRRSHDESLTLIGWWSTAWPFLVGVLVGWGFAVAVRRQPGSFVGGLVVWVSTVLVGMLLRVLTGAGTALPFVVVATLVTGALLLASRVMPAQRMPRRT